jgi:integrase
MPFEIEVFEENPETVAKKNNLPVENSLITDTEEEEIKYFYYDEYSRFLEYSKGYYRLVYLFLFETGARIEEARAVKFKDLDQDASRVKIKTLKQRNKNRFRIPPISDKLGKLILNHKMNLGLNNDDYILAKCSGKKPVCQQAVDAQMKRDCKILGIEREKAHCHAWRHTRAIQLLDSGEITLPQLMLFLGHTSIQSTLVYLKYSNWHLNKAIRAGTEKLGLL